MQKLLDLEHSCSPLAGEGGASAPGEGEAPAQSACHRASSPLPNPSPTRGEGLASPRIGLPLRSLLPLPNSSLVVAFSGGMDSTVLLHALSSLPEARERGLRAIHVHHGLQAEADAWAGHCEAFATQLGIPIAVLRVQVDRTEGRGAEGSARAARLAAFRSAVMGDEVLALAHHRDDQAETVLLRLLRGAGGDGLAAMRRRSRLGGLHLWRPLLAWPRSTLRAHADAHALRWVEDPSNAQTDFDRNFLRHRVLPLLRERWPHADASLARSASLLAEQATYLRTTTGTALDALLLAPTILPIHGLLACPRAQRAHLLRAWLWRLHGSPPPARVLATIESDVLPARHDRAARLEWAGMAIRRWRDDLYAHSPQAPLPTDWSTRWDGRAPLSLPGGGRLELHGADAFDAPLTVCTRQGGERIRLPGRAHHHALKHLLQTCEVPPWTRARMPLLFAPDGELLAAGDAILSARMHDWLRERGACLRWDDGIEGVTRAAHRAHPD
ncbi:MAG: tRNA lysidine(34) synthetase TilS [Proteobacteria bacterium]|nr:tRNA lysidine(34) synthetase TilS [Pseudomonadota bacterium]